MDEISRLYAKTPILKRKNSSLRIQRKKSSQPLKSPADRILFLQRTIGNQAVQRLIKSGTLQAKLRIGQPGDKYEQEADRVADAVMRMPEPGVQRQTEEEEEETLQAKPLAEEITPLVQRQFEPEEEPIEALEEEEEPIMTKALSYGTLEVIDNLHTRLNRSKGGGHKLRETDRNFMEKRFGSDFSGVRVHTDSNASQMSRELNAQAFTYGSDIYFGAEKKYPTTTSSGTRLIAHELTHVIQQKAVNYSVSGVREFRNPGNTIMVQRSTPEGGLGGLSPGTLARLRQTTRLAPAPRTPGQASTGPQATRPATVRHPIHARGPNPSTCVLPLCTQVSRPPVPSSDAGVRQRASNWLRQALACVRTGARGSNASHANAIVSNEEAEMGGDVQQYNSDFAQRQPRRRRHYREFIESLESNCHRKQRELRIEFHYNVVFENEPSLPLHWGHYHAEWSTIEAALAALPSEATWSNPLLLRFRRGTCHPRDVDARTGSCVGHAGGFVGGQMTLGTAAAGTPPPGTARIEVFQAGLGAGPYPRSRQLGIPQTAQTIRHEVGHVVASQIPQATKDNFFENVVGWHDYPWNWITASAQLRAQRARWQAERSRLLRETGFNHTQLDAWLSNLVLDRTVVLGPRTYVRRQYYLQSYEISQVPTGREFEYARTDQEEYLAELYALAVSRPGFMHSVLPSAQVAWLKRTIFRTPTNLAELARQYALAEPAQTQFVIRGSRMFTREQLDALMNELLIQSQQPGARLA